MQSLAVERRLFCRWEDFSIILYWNDTVHNVLNIPQGSEPATLDA